MVRLDFPTGNWPVGTEGTVVETFSADGIIEIEGETVLVPYTAMTVVWSLDGDRELA